MIQYTTPGGTTTTATNRRKLTPAIWGGWQTLSETIRSGAQEGVAFFDDFKDHGWTCVTNTTNHMGPYTYFLDNGPTIIPYTPGIGAGIIGSGTATNYGAIKFVVAGTEDLDAIIQREGAQFLISDTSKDDKKMVFEARVAINDVTDAAGGVFIGLAQPGRAIAAGIYANVDDGTFNSEVADIAMLGFHFPDDDGNTVDFIYGEASQTAAVAIADITSLTADTFIKLGFIYDPAYPTASRIRCFINEVEYTTTYITGTTIATAAFPDATPMVPTLCKVGGGGAAQTLTVDYWGGFQSHAVSQHR